MAGLPGRLVERRGGRAERTFVLDMGTATIGRGQDCDVVVDSQFISQRHAEVRWDGDEHLLVDLSKNGTFVNGVRLTGPHPLRHGDVIVLPGLPSLALVFEAAVATATWTPEAAPGPAIRVDRATAELWVRGQKVHVRRKEYLGMVLLAEKNGELVTKEELAARVWEEVNGAVGDADIAQLISGLRRKLEEDPDHPRHLITVRGLGYRLIVS